MSAPAFAWALERGRALDLLPADRLVLIYLADMANGIKECWPGQPLIESFTGLAPKTVRASIHRLAEAQLIRVILTPGKVTRYLILRPDTPANGAGGNDQDPGKMSPTTPVNGGGAPRQNVPAHPSTIRPAPQHHSSVTPVNGAPDPSYTQEKTLERAGAREAKQDFQIREEEEGGASPPVSPAEAPAVAATAGGGDIPEVRSSDAWLDDPTPDDALPKAEADSLDDDAPATKEAVAQSAARAIAEITQSLRMRAYAPGRASSFTRNEMVDVLEEKPRIKPAYLPDALLRAAREQLARREGAS